MPAMLQLPAHLKPANNAHRRFDKKALLRYSPDWLVTVLLVAAFGALTRVDGFHREFSLTDTSIQHTFAVQERIPFWECIVLAIIIPLCIMVFVSLVVCRNLWDTHAAVLGLVLSEGLTFVFTESTKIIAGRPRPDLIDRCRPLAGSTNATPFGLATDVICTRTNLLKDGFRSFPSGHSSTAFAGLGFLSFYLAGKLHLFQKRGATIAAWLSMSPLLGAALIAISRTMDNRHQGTDVLAGSALGLIIGYFGYRLYYPGLQCADCHAPYAPPEDWNLGDIAISSSSSEDLPLHNQHNTRTHQNSVYHSPVAHRTSSDNVEHANFKDTPYAARSGDLASASVLR